MKKKFVKKLIILGTTTLIMSNMYYVPASAKWIKDSKNNWNWMEGKDKVTKWKQIDKKWYYFNEDGVMSTGWIKYSDKWYNLSNNGEMNTGWEKINGKWYHFNSDGTMSIGWINDNDTWYFTNSNGEMETGTVGINGEVYNFSDSGAMIKNKETIQKIQSDSGDVKNEESNKDKKEDKTRVGYVSTNSDSLNVRLESKISSEIIGNIAKNSEVKIIGDEENEFYPTVINNKKGWVSSKWISFEKPKDLNASTNSSSNTNLNINLNTNSNANLNAKSNTNTEGTNTYNYGDIKDESLDKDIIRDTEPSLDDKHYYSDNNPFYKIGFSPLASSGGSSIKGNCTWYAWGRAWEVTGSKPEEAGFIGNAYEWWQANKKSGKYEYGSKPRAGAIAVWKSDLPNSGGSGHVAVVEKIKDGKVYISESMWHGAAFKYREIYETSYLYGYIYLDKPNY